MKLKVCIVEADDTAIGLGHGCLHGFYGETFRSRSLRFGLLLRELLFQVGDLLP